MIPCHYQCPIHTSAFPQAKLLLFVNWICWSGIPFPFTYKLVKNKLKTALFMSKKLKKNQPVWVWSVTFERRSELEVKNIFSPLIYCKRENPKVHRPGSYKRNQICSDLHKNCWEHFSIWYCAKLFLFTRMVKHGQCHRNCCAEHTKPQGSPTELLDPHKPWQTQSLPSWAHCFHEFFNFL